MTLNNVFTAAIIPRIGFTGRADGMITRFRFPSRHDALLSSKASLNFAFEAGQFQQDIEIVRLQTAERLEVFPR